MGPSVKVNPPANRSTGASRSINSENSRRSAEWLMERLLSSGRKPLPSRQGLDDGARNRVLQAADHLSSLDKRRPIMDRKHEGGAAHNLLDRGPLLPLRRAVIAGDARLHVADLAERFDELVVNVVEH